MLWSTDGGSILAAGAGVGGEVRGHHHDTLLLSQECQRSALHRLQAFPVQWDQPTSS